MKTATWTLMTMLFAVVNLVVQIRCLGGIPQSIIQSWIALFIFKESSSSGYLICGFARKKSSSKGNARQSPNFAQRGIHHELLKVVTLATLADPNSARVHLPFTAHSLEGSLVPSSASPPPSVSRVSSPLVSLSGSPLGLSDSPSGTSLFFISLVLFELRLLSGFLWRAFLCSRRVWGGD